MVGFGQVLILTDCSIIYTIKAEFIVSVVSRPSVGTKGGGGLVAAHEHKNSFTLPIIINNVEPYIEIL